MHIEHFCYIDLFLFQKAQNPVCNMCSILRHRNLWSPISIIVPSNPALARNPLTRLKSIVVMIWFYVIAHYDYLLKGIIDSFWWSAFLLRRLSNAISIIWSSLIPVSIKWLWNKLKRRNDLPLLLIPVTIFMRLLDLLDMSCCK